MAFTTVANPLNNRFLEEHYNVLCHHIHSILQSSLILDEDMRLLTTFWNPVAVKKKSNLKNLILAISAVAGFIVSLKLNKTYPIILLGTPAALELSQKLKRHHFESKYKRNFERLLLHSRELYELNKKIMNYYRQKDMAFQNKDLTMEVFAILLKPGEDFLRNTTDILIDILIQLKANMIKICDHVPILEGEHIYMLKLDIEGFRNYSQDYKDMIFHFEKINDMYVLMISNFMSCVGLSFCVQLWKDPGCNFLIIFKEVIPELLFKFKSSIAQIKKQFDSIRFTLFDDGINRNPLVQKKTNLNLNSNMFQLEQVLIDHLENIQLSFDATKMLLYFLQSNYTETEYQTFIPHIKGIKNRAIMCDDSLETVIKMFSLFMNETHWKKIEGNAAMAPRNNEISPVNIVVRYDDPEEPLKDEEFNLSIHGSDDDDFLNPIIEYADQCSNEYLELMLSELKKRLNERRVAKGVEEENVPIISKSVKASEVEHNLKIPPSPPSDDFNLIPLPPTPPLTIEQLPPLDNEHLSFLDSIKNVAQQLNRDEEVFGSDSLSSSSDP